MQLSTQIPSPSPIAIWIGNNWEKSTTLPVHPTDRGLLHGLGLFETLLAVQGQIPFLDWHLERLSRSCDFLRSTAAFPHPPDWSAGILTLIPDPASAPPISRVRLTLTGGPGSLRDLTPTAPGLAWISHTPLDTAPESLTLTRSPWTRNPSGPMVGHKSTSYAENLVALDHARRAGFDEALFLTPDGHLVEAATANLFLLINDQWVTPPLSSGCLLGITRRWMLENGAIEGHLTESDLEKASAILLTSATRGPIPVRQLDHIPFPNHPATSAIRQKWLTAAGLPSGS
jgi:branched-subunit amino acid aminotransferase/4-amino-4-deoxychorismate lyase